MAASISDSAFYQINLVRIIHNNYNNCNNYVTSQQITIPPSLIDNDPYLNNAKVQKLAAYISNLFLALLLKIPLNSGR